MRLRHLLVTALIAALALPAAALAGTGSPPITLAEHAPASVVLGGTASVSLTASNPDGPYGYNLSFTDVLPAGTSYVAGSATPAPTVIANAPTTGKTTLIWANLADLSPNASYTLSFQVAHTTSDPSLIQVGSAYTDQASAYISDLPHVVPTFSATGVVDPATYSGSDTTSATTTIAPFAITGAGGGKELRGAHDNQFVHTLTITNNAVADTDDAVVDDYLPAGLEFLGCGTTDNTTDAPTNPSSPLEYPNAAALSAGNRQLGTDCPTPVSVATVSDPPGLPAGTYTHVVWDLGTLDPGQVTTIQYVTAIPIRQNTTDWTGTAPTPDSLGQTANLDNNSGPETRQGTALVTVPSITGAYQGPTAPGTPATQTQSTSITNVAEDLEITKTASSGSISVGGITTWTLTLDTSEYRGATGIVVTDTLPNGLCPLGAPAADYVPPSGRGEPDCGPGAYPPATYGPTPDYASATENADGTWTLTWDAADMAAEGTQTITFMTLTRAAYQSDYADTTPVLAGDGWTNSARVTGSAVVRSETVDGTPTEIDHDTDNGDGTALADSSAAGQSAAQPSIQKFVALPGSYSPGGCPTDPADYVAALTAPASYRPGDTVCWRVLVNFASDLNTQVATLTDFLPTGQTYVAGSLAALADATVTGSADTSIAGQITWSGLVAQARTGSIIPTGGQVFDEVFASTAADATVAGPGIAVDNLAKLATTNTAGISSSPRAEAGYTVAGPTLTLTKGVSSVSRDGTTVLGPYGPNTDGIAVQPGDAVTFRIDITNTGTDPAADATVWDVLPTGISCADVGDLATATSPAAASCQTVDGHDTIAWTGVGVAANSSTTLYATYTVPLGQFSSYERLTDTAGVVSYRDGTTTGNTGDTYTYVPADNIDATRTATNAPAASDPSNITVAPPAITKTATTGITEPGNSATQATIGETVGYTVTVPLVHDTVLTGATITDPIPAGETLDTASVVATYAAGGGPAGPLPADWTLTTTPTSITIALPTPTFTVPSDGASVVLTFTATVANIPANTAGTTITNTATFATMVGGTSQSTAASASTPVVEPAITVTKTDNAGGQPVAPGQAVTYTLTATNGSGATVSTAHDATVTDTLPAGLCVVQNAASPSPAGTVAGDCTTTGQTITWTLGTMAPGAGQTLTYQATVGGNLPAQTALTNTATMTASSIEAGGRTYTSTATDTVTTSAPTVTKTVLTSPAVGTNGSELAYRVQVVIPANETLPDATVSDDLPAGFAFASQTAISCPGCGITLPTAPSRTSGPVVWDLGDIPSGAAPRTLTIQYQVVVGADAVPGSHTNTATLAWTANGATATLTDSASATTEAPALGLTKTVSCDDGAGNLTSHTCDVTAGTPLAYTVTVANTGNWPAFDATITDTPPAGLTGISAISSGGTYAAGTITWHLAGPIPAGGTVPLTYRARVTADTADLHDGQTLTNTARVGTYYGLDAADRAAHPDDAITYPGGAHDADVLTVRLPQLAISKTHSGDLPRGGTGDYTIVVSNVGTHATTQPVTVTDTPPAGMTPLAASGQGWTCRIARPTMTCTRADALAPKAAYPPITLTVAIVSNAPDSLVNTASATGGGGRPETVSDDDPTVITGAIRDGRLEITKTTPHATVSPGGLVRYTITVHNPGPLGVFDAVTCDRIPAYTTYVAAPGARFVDGQACWTEAYIGAGHTFGYLVVVRVSRTAPPVGITNTARVTSRNAPPAAATARVRVLAAAPPLGDGGVTG